MLIFFVFSAWAIDLEGAYRTALNAVESQQTLESKKVQASETVNQAWGTVMPSISFGVGYTVQDTTGVTGLGATNNYQQFGRFSLSQNLFAGTTEYFGLGAAKTNVAVTEANVSQGELTLADSVASSYFAVIQAEQSLQNIRDSLELTRKRVAELAERARIGRSRKGEVLSAKAQLITLEAAEEQNINTVFSAREALARATKLGRDVQLERALDRYLPPKEVPSLAALEAKVVSRPDLVAARGSVTYAEQLLSVAKGGHLPTLALGANYYINRENAFFLGGSDWDVTLTLTVPIFAGGVTQSKVRSAAETWKQSVLSESTLERENLSRLRAAHSAVVSGQRRLGMLNEALTTAESNYREQVRDYGNGLVTNLDVISASQALLDARQSRDTAITTLCTAWVSLRVAAGVMPFSARGSSL